MRRCVHGHIDFGCKFGSILQLSADICVDAFTKWAKVVPFERNDARSFAEAFVQVCGRWVLRCDNGRELMNTVKKDVYDAFGMTGRQQSSQGVVERFNRTLLTMPRKTLDVSDD